jgi:hypothetical protein
VRLRLAAWRARSVIAAHLTAILVIGWVPMDLLQSFGYRIRAYDDRRRRPGICGRCVCSGRLSVRWNGTGPLSAYGPILLFSGLAIFQAELSTPASHSRFSWRRSSCWQHCRAGGFGPCQQVDPALRLFRFRGRDALCRWRNPRIVAGKLGLPVSGRFVLGIDCIPGDENRKTLPGGAGGVMTELLKMLRAPAEPDHSRRVSLAAS